MEINSSAVVSSPSGSFHSIFGDQVEQCIIGEGVTSIGEKKFNYCKNLTSITIPSSVTGIGEYNQEIEGETNVEIIPVSA